MNKEKQTGGCGGNCGCKSAEKQAETATPKTGCCSVPKEINGFEAQGLLEPTRYGDWDVKGRCSDF